MSIKDKFTGAVKGAKDGITGLIFDDGKCTAILIAGGILALGLLGANAIFDKNEDEEKMQYIDVEDQEEYYEEADAETETVSAEDTVLMSAWERELPNGTIEIMVFEPDGFNNADGQMCHTYIENPKKTLKNRYYGDTYYVANFKDNVLSLQYDHGEANGNRGGEYQVTEDGQLVFGDAVYKAKSLDELVHFSFSYGTGADEGDNFVDAEQTETE